MPLFDLWKAQPNELASKQIDQLIAIAGEGKLRDDNDTSREFREFLQSAPSRLLARYSHQCLEKSFGDSGLALQDIVNEVGRRLGFGVRPGRYRGSQKAIGFDGLWTSPEGRSIVVEVKTTDAYRFSLETLAGYRRRLSDEGIVPLEESSILIVVGREDTGDLEAQIRGSRHAWDMRLISVEYLLRLLTVREDVENPQTAGRIRAVLAPEEFTRVDGIIDLIFSTAEDLQEEELSTTEPTDESPSREQEKTPPASFHQDCVRRIQFELDEALVRRSRATFSTPEDRLRVVCVVSKAYEHAGQTEYWYSFHPHQAEFLETAPDSFVALGCGAPEQILLIRFQKFAPWLDAMNRTDKGQGEFYWHVKVRRSSAGTFDLRLRKGTQPPDLTEYLIEPRSAGNPSSSRPCDGEATEAPG